MRTGNFPIKTPKGREAAPMDIYSSFGTDSFRGNVAAKYVVILK